VNFFSHRISLKVCLTQIKYDLVRTGN
jgi:hypothetical protein